MIRGCQKRIYYIKDPHSPLFAEAYFILKETEKISLHPGSPSAARLAAEADRIIAAFSAPDAVTRHHRSAADGKRGSSSAGQKFGAFIIGAASSSAIIGGIALLLVLA